MTCQESPPANTAELMPAWEALVEKALGGADFEKKLVTETYDGVHISPLYGPHTPGGASASEPGLPGQFPHIRGRTSLSTSREGWDIRQLSFPDDIAQANQLMLEDLQGGVSSIQVELWDGEHARVNNLQQLDQLFGGVHLEMAPIALRAGPHFLASALQLINLWEKRGHSHHEVRGTLGADPLGTQARGGLVPDAPATLHAAMAKLALFSAKELPHVRSVSVDLSPYHEAGASNVQCLGFALATGVSYLRTLTDAGLTPAEAAAELAFHMPLDSEFFSSIACLRALRNLWSRVLKSCGVDSPEAAAWVHASPSRRILTQRDPWVNQLRNTVCCFAGAVAGADAITTLPHNIEFAGPSSFSNRVARNTQVVLSSESHLSRVIDAAGGAYFIESVTQELSKRSWDTFTGIEQAGGMQAALSDGTVQAAIESVATERARRIAKRKQPITGVSEFANLAEDHLGDAASLATQTQSSPKPLALNLEQSFDDLLATSKTAEVSDLTHALLGSLSHQDGLPVRRDARAFEALRDRSDAWLVAHGARPKVWLACLGTLAEHNGRAAFIRNLLNAGGIDTTASDPALNPEQQVDVFKNQDTSLVIICGADKTYTEQASPIAQALKGAGAKWVGLAGRPRDTLPTDGIDSFLYLGCNVLETLDNIWTLVEDSP